MRNPTGHPARFSDSIIDHFKTLLVADERVHDPFAGTGEQLGRLADEIGFRFTGTEIEQSFIVDPRVRLGDSTKRASYPRTRGWTGCTSPVYPNGNADYFASSSDEKKPWKRNTYRHAIAKRSGGAITELADNNMARFGYRGTKPMGQSTKRIAYWDLARRCVPYWSSAAWFVLNVSDFQSGDYTEPLVGQWVTLMEENGWAIERFDTVVTPRYRNGSDESRDQRVEAEAVILFRRG